MMHYYHRMTYMGERIKYALRRQQAQEMPSLYCSMISGGMAQNHCELPWYGNQKSAERKLPQHLQGVLNHGRNFTAYRTFHNVRGGGNLSVHCLLSSIEKCETRRKVVPFLIRFICKLMAVLKIRLSQCSVCASCSLPEGL